MNCLSLCMIVKDEEAVLGRCLESLKGAAEEIIVVDTGSADRTKAIAAGYTDKIYDFKWNDDFSAARNFAVSRATGDYWMWLDADDVLAADAPDKLRELKEKLPLETDVIMMPYAAAFDGNNRPVFTYYRERILKNIPRYRFQGRVHEVVVPSGRIEKAEILVEHRPGRKKESDRNLRIYEKMKKGGQPFSSRELYYYGRELLEHGRYSEAEEVFSQFLRRPDGWLEDRIEATRRRAACLKALDRREEAAEALLSSLLLDTPRAETCCALGDYFMEDQNFRQAAWWFEQALAAEKREDSGAFIWQDCYGYIPAMNLCVCYDRMNEPERARAYNELAGAYKPDDPAYLSNRNYFDKKQNMNCGI